MSTQKKERPHPMTPKFLHSAMHERPFARAVDCQRSVPSTKSTVSSSTKASLAFDKKRSSLDDTNTSEIQLNTSDFPGNDRTVRSQKGRGNCLQPHLAIDNHHVVGNAPLKCLETPHSFEETLMISILGVVKESAASKLDGLNTKHFDGMTWQLQQIKPSFVESISKQFNHIFEALKKMVGFNSLHNPQKKQPGILLPPRKRQDISCIRACPHVSPCFAIRSGFSTCFHHSKVMKLIT